MVNYSLSSSGKPAQRRFALQAGGPSDL